LARALSLLKEPKAGRRNCAVLTVLAMEATVVVTTGKPENDILNVILHPKLFEFSNTNKKYGKKCSGCWIIGRMCKEEASPRAGLCCEETINEKAWWELPVQEKVKGNTDESLEVYVQ
jgi:hypothetical protein